jgi:hypothetical protein
VDTVRLRMEGVHPDFLKHFDMDRVVFKRDMSCGTQHVHFLLLNEGGRVRRGAKVIA